MAAVGDKVRARRLMTEAGVPVIPGTPPLGTDVDAIARAAKKIGFPVLLKAAAGGGGKGMRIVRDAAGLPSLLAQARGEAASAFGDDTVFIEKFIERPRHVEVQILADNDGNCIHLGERECSIQRRHQKLIEECPSPVVDPATRKKIGQLAVTAVKAADYVGAGTVEFLRGDDGTFYFMEINARLQVEHPVTEMVTGIDLVKAMINIAAGGKLPVTQKQFTMRGHAIECRIIAEDPARNFMPSPGTIRAQRIPGGPGVRFDGGTYDGYTVPLEYDPLIGKLCCWGRDREHAIARMSRALDEMRIDGLMTSTSFHQQVMHHPAFVEGDLHTGFLEQYPELLSPPADPWLEEIAIVAAAVAHFRRMEIASRQRSGANHAGGRSPWRQGERAGWRA
jgi:acetyl-CoA carboxylase biotin carboxylase subunit